MMRRPISRTTVLSPTPRNAAGYGLACLMSLAVAGCQPAERTVPSSRAAEARRVEEPALPEGECVPRAVALTPGQRRGREIYLHGSVPGARSIRAVLGQSREPIDAALLACGNCHGHDGRGRPEGGVEPPDVTWPVLSKSYGATDRFGRRRPAYTESLLGRVVTMGLDSSGRRLDTAMPRYQLGTEELADLVDYLTVLGRDTDPGLTPSTITIGTLLPPDRFDPEWRQVVLATLNAYADEVNRLGGLYGRRLEVVHEEIDRSREGADAAVTEFLDRRSVFALVAADIRGVDEEVVLAVEARRVPLIGPFTLRPGSGLPTRRSVFYLHAGLEDQARALALAARPSGSRASAIIHDDDEGSTRAASAVADEWARSGGACERIAIRGDDEGLDPDRLVARLMAQRTEVVAYFGPRAALRPLLVAADRASWRPEIYLPGALASPDLFDLPLSFGGKIVLALPYLPDDLTPAGAEQFARIRAASGLPERRRAAQMAVLAAAKVMEEGIRRCGRALSRARMIDELERLDAFSTGFSRPLTFGPNRRVGSAGAYLLSVDLPARKLQPTGGWVEVEGRP
jgi:ABC-type branched-subunit amino acid transport system substrate-binding protein